MTQILQCGVLSASAVKCVPEAKIKAQESRHLPSHVEGQSRRTVPTSSVTVDTLMGETYTNLSLKLPTYSSQDAPYFGAVDDNQTLFGQQESQRDVEQLNFGGIRCQNVTEPLFVENLSFNLQYESLRQADGTAPLNGIYAGPHNRACPFRKSTVIALNI